MEFKKEFLHAIIDHLDFVINHHPDSHQPNHKKITNSERKEKKSILVTDSFVESMSRGLPWGRHSRSSLSLPWVFVLSFVIMFYL